MHLHGNLLFNSDVQNPCRIELLGDWFRIMETASVSDAEKTCHSDGGSSGSANDFHIVSVKAAEMEKKATCSSLEVEEDCAKEDSRRALGCIGELAERSQGKLQQDTAF